MVEEYGHSLKYPPPPPVGAYRTVIVSYSHQTRHEMQAKHWNKVADDAPSLLQCWFKVLFFLVGGYPSRHKTLNNVG